MLTFDTRLNLVSLLFGKINLTFFTKQTPKLGYNQGCTDPNPGFLPKGSGSVKIDGSLRIWIRRIDIEIANFFRFCFQNYKKFVNFLVFWMQISFVTK